jgi:hypothetical protein
MLVKALGAFDIIAGLILIFGAGVNLPTNILTLFGIILIAKSFFGQLKGFASWIDLIAGIIFLISIIINLPGIIGVIMGIFLFQKGIFSFL